jgi:hypothetical protein
MKVVPITSLKTFLFLLKDPVIINISKVDLELDGKADYVITAVNIIDRENRETKFLALDENFKPKRIFIAHLKIHLKMILLSFLVVYTG